MSLGVPLGIPNAPRSPIRAVGCPFDSPVGFTPSQPVTAGDMIPALPLSCLVNRALVDNALDRPVDGLPLVIRPVGNLFLRIITLKEPLWAGPVGHVQEHGPFGLGELVST